MKVLWLTNTFLPERYGSVFDLRESGGWMSTLMAALKDQTGLELSVASARPAKQIETYITNGIRCFVVPCGKRENAGDQRNALLDCCKVIDQVRPDLVHVHGTERFYGLLGARRLISCPVAISLQGLLGPCSEWYHYFGNRRLLDIIRMHRLLEIPLLRGHWYSFWDIRNKARREREIIQGNRFFMGRTAWDRAYSDSLNPHANYYPVGELLREPFWKKRWTLTKARRHRIIFTNAGHPRKGPEIILDAVSLLKQGYPSIQLCIAGGISRRSGYGRYLRNRMAPFGDTIIELGPLNAEEMAQELIKSHVFVSPSFIDNSPNAVCEAQLIGMPVISTYTGGVPSLIEEGRTGLFFPTGDAAMLAARLTEVFNEDALAVCLGAKSHDVARLRHDPDAVVKQLVSAYESVMQIHSGTSCLGKDQQ